MTSETLYRKYRPTNFDEIIGQDGAKSILQGVVTKKLMTPLLLVGTRGVGKTTLARIVAKSLDVQAEDIYELDAASNRGIDDIRALREEVYTLPLTSAYKVYILDEAHMLTKEAWNALLKTLEEPPKYVLFILATTEIEKVPETILSRTQIVRLTPQNKASLGECIDRVTSGEQVVLTPDAREMLIISANGSFRDLLSNLQTVLVASGDKAITESEVQNALGVPPIALVRDVVAKWVQGNTEESIALLYRAKDSGTNMIAFAKLILERIEWGLRLRMKVPLPELVSDDRDLVEQIAKNPKIVSQTLAKLIDALQTMSNLSQPEIALSLWLQLHPVGK